MSKFSRLYKQYIYGIMGTLIFHILLFGSFLLAEINLKREAVEEPIIIDFSNIEEIIEQLEQQESQADEITPSGGNPQELQNRSNQAINRAIKDPFFDEAYKQEIENAQKLVSDVNEQLSKEIPELEDIAMPEETTEGMDPDSIKNVIFSGESNIEYFLENRYHTKLPIPVYLTQGGGTITIDIYVDRSGRVKKTEVAKTKNTNDPMLAAYALQAARKTFFNRDAKAPELQKGTITYTFVPQ